MSELHLSILAEKKVCWLAAGTEESPEKKEDTAKVVISSRIRLARNVKDCFFPARADDPALMEIREGCARAVKDAMKELSGNPMLFHMDLLTENDRNFLLERHFISREFLNCRKGSALVADADAGVFVMINEEDHLRLQYLAPAMALKELWQKISLLDDRISCRIPYAFDPAAGYLTGSPSNAGSGMRASAMLHLPALALSGQLNAVCNAVKALKLVLRGFNGGNSSMEGNFCQLSNQSTLGETESMTIARLEKVISQLVHYESKTRLFLLEKKRDLLLNFAGRSYAIAKYSYSLKSKDALNALSGIMLGAEMGMFPKISVPLLKELLLNVQDAHLQLKSGRLLSEEERDSIRATLLREFLQGKNPLQAKKKHER